MTPHIRRATLEDAESIAGLAAQVQELHHDDDPATYKPPDPEATLPWFREWLSNPATIAFIAENDAGEPIGYAITFEKTRDDNAVRRAEKFVELNEIGVDATWRGKGVGRALHDHIVAHWTAAGAREIRLTVIAFNDGARRHYEKLGFTEASRRMVLRLPD